MQDVQSQPDFRELPIDKVGICDLRYPIVVWDKMQEKQQTTALLSLSVSLPKEYKGTHMSRFVEVLERHRGEMSMVTLPLVLQELKEKLEADSAQMTVQFPYFVEKQAPVSKAISLLDLECTFRGETNAKGETDFVLGVVVPVTSLCPCSKVISDYGAHNQRGLVDIQLRMTKDPEGESSMIWIEDVLEIAEKSASAPLYSLLKREDERFVTMQAYDNPVFVEDLVRNVATHLMKDPRVQWFQVQVTNQESIHNHNAFASIAWGRES